MQEQAIEQSGVTVSLAWQALNRLPDVAVWVTDRDGQLLEANAQTKSLCFTHHDGTIIGATIRELASKPWADYLLATIDAALRDQAPSVSHTIWEGAFCIIAAYPIEDQQRCLLVMQFRAHSDPANGMPADETQRASVAIDVKPSPMVDLGPLDQLSQRELEVLALLRKRMRIKEIADELGRSEKTIEKHRQSIGAKLKTHDRLELAYVAELAGLTMDDAKRLRVSITPKNGHHAR